MNRWEEVEDELSDDFFANPHKLVIGPEVEVSPQMKLAQEIRATRTYVEEEVEETSGD